MKILGSKAYCAICKEPLQNDNLGAIIKEGSALNACQDPCATEYNQKQKYVKPKENQQDHVKVNESLVIIVNNDISITISKLSSDPIQISFDTLLADYNITTFCITHISIENRSYMLMNTIMKRNESTIAVLPCKKKLVTNVNFRVPIIIINNDLTIEGRPIVPHEGDVYRVIYRITGRIIEREAQIGENNL